MLFTVASPAKINLALNITGIRPNGYHALDMLMQTISLQDELVFEDERPLSLAYDTPEGIVPAQQDDLVLRAALALAREAGIEPYGRVTLRKRIPSMAGLGGGSSDCAASLKAFARLWHLSVPEEDFSRLAFSLGSDVPFFLKGGTARVAGTGEIVLPLKELPSYSCLLLVPRPGLSTPAVYRAFDEARDAGQAASIDQVTDCLRAGDLAGASAASGNALERAACRLSPRVSDALACLKATGSPFVLMSGSGSAVYALFDDPAYASEAAKMTSGILTRFILPVSYS